MKNYFETQRVNWKTWNPSQVIFKSNRLIKKLMPEENVLSWTSKGDRNHKMCQLTKGKVQTGYQGKTYHGSENLKGVMVQLKDMNSEFPSANIDFIDYTHRKDSVGNNVGRLDVLVYLNSYHAPWEYVRCPQTNNWVRKQNGSVAPIEEGYRMCYGGQGDSNSMLFDEFQELIQITEAVKNFLVEVLVPVKNGEYDYSELMVA
tara:strand:- start:14087 stop:14695 length:609 start_codon:yes stop_codon:yes gene_type:complete